MLTLLEQMLNGLEKLLKGGPMLVPLLFFSVVAMSVVLERLSALRRDELIPSEYIARIYRLLERGRFDMAVKLCESRPMLLTNLLRFGIQRRHESEAILLQEVRDYVRIRGQELYRNIFILGLVSAIAPLFGLLGTVLGMIRSFSALWSGGGSDQLKIVADGISVALLTTFAGLVVAVPSFIMYRYLLDRADGLARELQRYGVALVRFLKAEEMRLQYEEEALADKEAFEITWEEDTSS